jgi:uncharacterized protein (TIGR03118 family)
MRDFRRTRVTLGGLWLLVWFTTAAQAASVVVQTNLTSDIPGLAQNTDANLKNPWGLGFSTTSPFWSGNQFTATTTLYNANGTSPASPPAPSVVGIPTAGGVGNNTGPTGVVNNSVNGVATSDFTLNNGSAATFLFATLNGTIAGWNSGDGLTGPAETRVTTPGAIYTGLALANNGAQNLLYAADNAAGAGHAKIAVFDKNFQPVALSGNFIDPVVPTAAPYNIQFLNGKIYVTYQAGDVGIFDTNGNFLQNIANSNFKSPWGLAIAPAGFGQFAGDLLVGNRTDGEINAFTASGSFDGTLLGANGQPISIPGLWALAFRASGTSFDPNALYFTAGLNQVQGSPNIFTDGLFGTITIAASVPEPTSSILLGVGLLVVWGVCHHRGARDRQGRVVSVRAGDR